MSVDMHEQRGSASTPSLLSVSDQHFDDFANLLGIGWIDSFKNRQVNARCNHLTIGIFQIPRGNPAGQREGLNQFPTNRVDLYFTLIIRGYSIKRSIEL